MPIKEKGKYDYQYVGNEYLQIYPHLDYEDGTSYYKDSDVLIERGYYISEPTNKYGNRYITKLEVWLKN